MSLSLVYVGIGVIVASLTTLGKPQEVIVAALVCIVPNIVGVMLAFRAKKCPPMTEVMLLMAWGLIRPMIAVGLGLGLFYGGLLPEFSGLSILLWGLVYYVLFMISETHVVMAMEPRKPAGNV
ncbi:MAG: hypothetical protein R3B84_07580 [Zavarzinella sp.]